jgi:hypothetical protein
VGGDECMAPSTANEGEGIAKEVDQMGVEHEVVLM